MTLSELLKLESFRAPVCSTVNGSSGLCLDYLLGFTVMEELISQRVISPYPPASSLPSVPLALPCPILLHLSTDEPEQLWISCQTLSHTVNSGEQLWVSCLKKLTVQQGRRPNE